VALALAQLVHRGVAGHAVQPRAELRALLESVEVAKDPQEGLLDHLFGILGTTRQPVGQPVHSSTVALYEHPESLLVARFGTGDDLVIGGVHLRC